MSDIIDAAAQPTTRPGPRTAMESAGTSPKVPARDYIRLTQGFYFVFWGLLLTVLTGAQLLMPVEMPSFAELFLGAGVLATLVGSWRLYQVRSLGDAWQHRTRWTLRWAALMTYFCLFFFLWRRAPESTWLLGNVFAFAATGIAYVLSFNRGVAALGAFLGRKDVAFESRVFGTGNVGLLLLPFACIVVYIIGMAVIQKSDPLSELRFLLSRANLLIIVVLLLPFSLTLSLAWSCKDAVLRQLSNLDHSRDFGADHP